MCPDTSLKSQTGAGLPIALFVITVLALLVIVMAQLQQGTGESLSLQIQSQRAFFAAESGAQVGVRGNPASILQICRTVSFIELSPPPLALPRQFRHRIGPCWSP